MLLFSFIRCFSWAQSPYGYYFQDSLKPKHRISGSLDSVDCYLASYQHTLPNYFKPYQFQFSFSDFSRNWFLPFTKRFSALPHIAFAYSMGSKLDQMGRVTYTQAVDTNTFLQVDYLRNSSNGNLRNSKFERNAVQVALMHSGKFYGTIVDLNFSIDDSKQSNGLLGDSLVEGFPIGFQQVKRSNTSNVHKQFNVSWKNYFSFLKDSMHKFGVILHPEFSISNNRFIESENMNSIYGFSNYDSIQTRDYRELSAFKTSGGLFYKYDFFQLEAGASLKYWKYDNLGRHADTSETSVFVNFYMSKNGYNLKSQNAYTLSGATGEKQFSLDFSKRFGATLIRLNSRFSQKYPEIYQRMYYGNVMNYTWQNKFLSSTFASQFYLENHNRIIPFTAKLFLESNSKLPVLVGYQWRQDTLTILQVAGVEVGASYSFKQLLLQARASYRFSIHNVLPNWVVFGRLAYNGTLFKGKKLKTVTGVDLGYYSSYQLMEFSPMANAYYFSNSGMRFREMMKLHFFTQFDLGYFRWFIRVENIEQTFWKKETFEAVGYPVTPLQFRFGVSWDFFN